MITRLRNVMDVLDERLSDEMDHGAAGHGWTVTRTGRFGLTRSYARVRCVEQVDDAEPNLAREGQIETYPGEDQAGETGVVLAWRELDSASGPRHSTQGE